MNENTSSKLRRLFDFLPDNESRRIAFDAADELDSLHADLAMVRKEKNEWMQTASFVHDRHVEVVKERDTARAEADLMRPVVKAVVKRKLAEVERKAAGADGDAATAAALECAARLLWAMEAGRSDPA